MYRKSLIAGIKIFASKLSKKIDRIDGISYSMDLNIYDRIVILFKDGEAIAIDVDSENASLELLLEDSTVLKQEKSAKITRIASNVTLDKVQIHIDKKFSDDYLGEYGLTFLMSNESIVNFRYASNSEIVDSIIVDNELGTFHNGFSIAIIIG